MSFKTNSSFLVWSLAFLAVSVGFIDLVIFTSAIKQARTNRMELLKEKARVEKNTHLCDTFADRFRKTSSDILYQKIIPKDHKLWIKQSRAEMTKVEVIPLLVPYLAAFEAEIALFDRCYHWHENFHQISSFRQRKHARMGKGLSQLKQSLLILKDKHDLESVSLLQSLRKETSSLEVNEQITALMESKTFTKMTEELMNIHLYQELLLKEDIPENIDLLKNNQILKSAISFESEMGKLDQTNAGVIELKELFSNLKSDLFGKNYRTGKLHENIEIAEGSLFVAQKNFLQNTHECRELLRDISHHFKHREVLRLEIKKHFAKLSFEIEAKSNHAFSQDVRESIVMGIILASLIFFIAFLIDRSIKKSVLKMKHTHAQLDKALGEAQQGVKAKGEFLATMSHEIRTPMNGVIGVADLISDTPLNEEQRDLVDTLKTSGHALLSVINDILDFSKMDAGKMGLESIDFDLRRMIQDIVKVSSFRSEAKGLELGSYIAPELPWLKGDPGRVRQIITNLFGNSLKFTESGSVAIHADIEKEQGDEISLRIEVRDTGIGIPKEKSSLLFQEFSQMDMSTTRKYGGTGLGLAICKKLVQQMKGDIGVESEESKGSTFWFRIKLQKSEKPPHQKASENTRLENKKILYVDDMQESRLLTQKYLKTWGCADSSLAVNGLDALEKIQQALHENKAFDLVITDHLMPQMDGMDLSKAIRENSKLDALKVILLSSAGLRGDSAKSREIGINAYLSKPITQSELYECIQKVFLSKPEELITKYSLEERQSGKSILLAEDNKINQKVAMKMLKKLGHRVDLAENGHEAVAKFNEATYDLILMDMQMPGMDGVEATVQIRKNEKDGQQIPIIALTANVLKEDKKRCADAGMNDFISKPLKLNTLAEVISQALS